MDHYHTFTRNSVQFSGYHVLGDVGEHRGGAAKNGTEHDFHILVDVL
jgi:hypothetical protein